MFINWYWWLVLVSNYEFDTISKIRFFKNISKPSHKNIFLIKSKSLLSFLWLEAVVQIAKILFFF